MSKQFNVDLVDQYVSEALLNKSEMIYILPIPSQSVEIAAALFGFKYSIKQLVLLDIDQAQNSENTIPLIFFWVIKPKHEKEVDFKKNIVKICQYGQIHQTCSIEVVKNQVTVQRSQTSMITQKMLNLDEIVQWIVLNFWTLFINDATTQSILRDANQEDRISEPQTNFARLARQLKANSILKELDLLTVNTQL